MKQWVDQLADWMQNREEISFDLAEKVSQTTQETDSLLEVTDQLQSVYTCLLGKVDHVNS